MTTQTISKQFLSRAGSRGSEWQALLAGDAILDRGPFMTCLAQLAPARDVSSPRAHFEALAELVPELVTTVIRSFTQDDRVASFVRFTSGEIDVCAVVVLWISGGLITRMWGVGDELRLLMQLDAAVLPLAIPGASDPDPATPPWLIEPTSSASPRKLADVATKLVEGVVSTGDQELAGQVLADDLTFSRPGLGVAFSAFAISAPTTAERPPEFSGLEGFRHGLVAIRDAFPDWDQHVTDGQVADGDIVVSPIRVSGTQRGALFGRPATDRHVVFDEVLIMRMRDDKIDNIWAMGDEAGFLLAFDMLKLSGAR